jgi:putative tryptophan/tyrosine transport system substrate-binding protein
MIRRRDFVALFGGAAASWPVIARGQERERLVCILETVSVNTPDAKLRHPAFLAGLQQSGWMPGRNVRIEVRWGEGDDAATRKHAAELIALTPDVLVAGGGVALEVLLKATHSKVVSCSRSRLKNVRRVVVKTSISP